jgi:peroxiredoxin
MLLSALPALMLALGCWTSLQAGESRNEAADFSLKNLNGEDIRLSQLYGNGPIVVNFWATWCKPCVKELPHLDEIYRDYKEKGVKVLAVSEDSPWSVSKVKSFIAGHHYSFTVLLDTNGKVLRKYGLPGTPYTFVLDEKGAIRYKHFGYRPGDEASLHEEIDKLLGVDTGGGKGETDGEGKTGG